MSMFCFQCEQTAKADRRQIHAHRALLRLTGRSAECGALRKGAENIMRDEARDAPTRRHDIDLSLPHKICVKALTIASLTDAPEKQLHSVWQLLRFAEFQQHWPLPLVIRGVRL